MKAVIRGALIDIAKFDVVGDTIETEMGKLPLFAPMSFVVSKEIRANMKLPSDCYNCGTPIISSDGREYYGHPCKMVGTARGQHTCSAAWRWCDRCIKGHGGPTVEES